MSESEEEEEIIVMAEFKNPVPPLSAGMNIKMIGLDTDTPTVQCEKLVFRGKWNDCIGTKILFGEKKVTEPLDPVFAPNVSKQFECRLTTRKLLELESYVLTPKEVEPINVKNTGKSEEDTTDDDTNGGRDKDDMM